MIDRYIHLHRLQSNTLVQRESRVLEFKENLEYFKVPSPSIDSIRTKLDMTIFDEYANILKGMYSIRFNGISHTVTT
jgi:hypothetical protein